MIALSIKRLTAHVHRRAEATVAAIDPFASIASYVRYLQGLHSFYFAIEPVLFARLDRLVIDAHARRKLSLIERDLDFFHATATSICASVPKLTSDALAMGVGYVLEGKTLGSRFLLEEAKQKLDLDADHGAAFFAGYRDQTGPMWKAYTKTLADYVAANGSRLTVVRGAGSAFAAFIATMQPLAAVATVSDTQTRVADSAA
jgi:heme oxygenase